MPGYLGFIIFRECQDCVKTVRFCTSHVRLGTVDTGGILPFKYDEMPVLVRQKYSSP